MAKLWAIVKREYIERVRTRWFLFATLFGPIFIGSILVIPILLSNRDKPKGEFVNTRILDATGTGFGERISQALHRGRGPGTVAPEVYVLRPQELSQAESTATRQVMAGQLSGFIVTDSRTVRGEEIKYAGRKATSLQEMDRLRSVVTETLLTQRLQGAGIDPIKVRDLTFIPLKLRTERISEKGRGGSGMVGLIFAAILATLLYVSIVLYGQNVMRSVLEEKSSRVAEVIVSSVRSETLLAGKILGVGAVGLTQQVVWVGTSIAMLKLRGPVLAKFGITTTPFVMPEISLALGLLLLLFFVLGFVFYASLYAAVGATVNSEQEAQQAAQPLMIMLVATAVLINPIILNSTSNMAKIMSWLPFSAPIIMPLRLSLGTVPWYELAATVVGLVLACLGAVWIAARVYRVGMLMYGKRPTFREMGHWIAYSR